MAATIIYYPSLTADFVDEYLTCTGEIVKYVNKVRRIKVGEKLVISNGTGLVLFGIMEDQTKDSFTVKIISKKNVDKSVPKVTIFQAILKGDQVSLALDLQTEAGVDCIIPWIAQRTIVNWDSAKADKAEKRWSEVVKSAAMQSRRPYIPELEKIFFDYKELGLPMKQILANKGIIIALHEEAEINIKTLLPTLNNFSEIGIIVGPEGGLTNTEVNYFAQNGAKIVKLGPNILRASTAAALVFSAVSVSTKKWDSFPLSF